MREKRSIVVFLHLKEVVAVEDFAVPLRHFDSAIAVALFEALEELGTGAAAEDGDAFGVLLEEFAVHAGLVVVALEVGLGDEREEVLVAGLVAGEEDEVVGLVVAAFAAEAGGRGDVGLDADDGLDAALAGSLVEVDGAIEGAMVGHRDRLHAEFLHPVEEGADLRHAVEQGVFGVGV